MRRGLIFNWTTQGGSTVTIEVCLPDFYASLANRVIGLHAPTSIGLYVDRSAVVGIRFWECWLRILGFGVFLTKDNGLLR